jgi:RNA polymerase sigma-54 factor
MRQVQQSGLVQEQRLSQKMSPQLIQSIKLMEMPIADLRDTIARELEKNPALEVLRDKSMVSLDTMYAPRRESDDYFEATSDSGYIHGGGGGQESSERQQFIEGVAAQGETLQEHLLWELRLQTRDDKLRAAAERLIQNLDADGFNQETPESLWANDGGIGKETFKKALVLARGLEPIGCCTNDYKESLAVQAALRYPDDAKMICKLIPALEELERGKLQAVAKRHTISKESACELFAKLKTLHPFPGRQWKSGSADSEQARFVIPDIQVIRNGEKLTIILNGEEIPVLGIQPFFMKQTKVLKNLNVDARDFVRENVREARWFIHSINRRNHTLLRVTRAILQFQRPFFIDGPKYLVPLTLRDIADTLEVHETTVSRSANGKYMQTEWGIYEIRHFFTNSISGPGSNSLNASRFSQHGVQAMIQEIIASDLGKLSDQEIAELLSKRGVNLARRTVAKYRSQIYLGSSYQR